jgi:hypothetical protein
MDTDQLLSQVGQIVGVEVRRATARLFNDAIALIIGIGVCLFLCGIWFWEELNIKNNKNNFCDYHADAEEPRPSNKVSKEDMDKVMYVYEKVKDIQKSEKEKEKQKEYTLEKIGEVKGEDLDTYLARHSSCSDAIVEEKVERILTKRAKVKEAEEV